MSSTSLAVRIEDFLSQKRIAVAGISKNHSDHPAGILIYRRLRKTGYTVFPVNPHLDSFEGDRCYPDVPSIPGSVDGVVIVTRPEVTQQVVHDCQRANVRRVWMHQSLSGGTSVSPEAAEFCRQHGIDVIAGACPMMYRCNGVSPDLGHTCIRWILGLTGRLPT